MLVTGTNPNHPSGQNEGMDNLPYNLATVHSCLIMLGFIISDNRQVSINRDP